MIICLCGKAGAGKDTAAEYFGKKYGYNNIHLADPLKRLVKDVFALTDNQVYDRIEREKPLENWNGYSVRMLLQKIGTELFRDNIDDEIWVKSLWYNIQKSNSKKWTISDVRFPNELTFLKEKAGEDLISIKLIREGCDGNVGIKGHISEQYDLQTDFIVENNGSFEKLHAKLDGIVAISGIES